MRLEHLCLTSKRSAALINQLLLVAAAAAALSSVSLLLQLKLGTNAASLCSKDSASRQTWTVIPRLTAVSVATLGLSPSPFGRSILQHQSSWKIKASSGTKHFSLLHSACFQTQIRAISGNTPKRRVPGSGIASVRLLGETQREGNQSVTAEGSTARGDSSSSIVTKSNRNQRGKIKCLRQTGGMRRAD